MRSKIRQLYTEKHLSSCLFSSLSSCLSSCLSSDLSYRLSVTFLPQKQPLHWQKNFYSLFVLKKNHSNGQPSRLRLHWTFPQKTASVPVSEKVGQHPVYWWWLFDCVISSEKRNFVTFQDVWWVRISTITRHNCTHMIINHQQVHV